MGSGKRKDTVHDIARQQPTIQEVQALIDQMAHEASPPIVVAVLGAALLEYDLERLLLPRFKRRDTANWARVTGEGGPLSTFSQKIIAGYAFGLFDDETRCALNIAKNIRNAFAHSKKLITFDHELIVAEFRSIRLPKAKRSIFYKRLHTVRHSKSEHRWSFILLCLVLSNRLTDRHHKALSKAQGAKHRRMMKKSPIYSAFMSLWPGDAPPTLGQGSLGGLYGDGPKAPESQGPLFGLLGPYPNALSKKDSK